MSPDRWDQVEALFAAALEHPPEQRAAYLAATIVDPEARSEALSLLFAHEAGGRFDRIVADLSGVNPAAESGPVPNVLDRLLVEQPGRLRAALAGRYTVERELGHGGMATVYLAQDERHHRPVAIKVLRPEIATGLGSERFLREIGIAARLNHPHILALLDSGNANGMLYYAMPFVEGESLRNRLTREPQLPLDVALQIAQEVADALSYAHSHDVIHRDIKPENILLSSGHALVADFGIARAITAAGSARLTETGLASGTPAYMSPEQAAGSPDVDGRSDLYALGCVLYEMLSGEPPYTGLTPQAILAKKLSEPLPRISVVRAAVPAAVEAALNKALARTPADRFVTAAQFAEALGRPGVAPRSRWLRPAMGVAAVVAIIAGGVVLFRAAVEPGVLALGKVTQLTFEPGLEIEPAISPDGKLVAYAAGPLSATRIYVRQPGGRPVALTADSGPPQRRPLWSPDGTRIVLQMNADLFVTPALGGAPRRMATGACCAAWSPDGRQVALVRTTMYRVRYERPESIYVTPLDGGPSRFVALVFTPHSLTWSPDGRWLAVVSGNAEFALHPPNKGPSAIVLVPAGGGPLVPVTDNAGLNVSPVWTPDSHHILFVSNRDGARDVYAVRLANSGMPAGRPSRLTTGLNAHSISLSADGARLAYSAYSSHKNVWAIPIPTDGPVSGDRATQITTGDQTVEDMTVSPDGRWLYFDSDRSGNADIYRVPLGGGELQQLTTNPADDFAPDVSPDGRWVAFHSTRFGTRDIFVMSAEGGEAERVTDDPGEERYPEWSPDGRSLSYALSGTKTRDGLYVILKDQRNRWGSPRRVWNHPSAPASWSQDGRTLLSTWTDGIWLIPAAGGVPQQVPLPDTVTGLETAVARWSQDGRIIYFSAADHEGRESFWALPVTGGRPRLLVRFQNPTEPFDWATDGHRFYFTINDEQSDIYVAEFRGLR